MDTVDMLKKSVYMIFFLQFKPTYIANQSLRPILHTWGLA